VNRRFIHYDISKTPTTHDSLAWEASVLGTRIANGELPMGLFINGDSAFNLGPGMMVPTNKEATTDFDFEQSSNRICIECAFGILVRHWGILWRPLEMKPKRRAPIIGACMRLHNFCIDKKLTATSKRNLA